MDNLATEMVIGIGILVVVFWVITIFFCVTLYTAMKRIPEQQHVFPAWFIWFFLVPIASFIFQWIMIPFGIPRTFRAAFSVNPEALQRIRTIYGVGLGLMITSTISFIPYVNIFTGSAAFILWIAYWVLVAKFKRMYLSLEKRQ